MGTNIHYYAEKRTDGNWEPAFQTYYEDENDPEERSLWHGEQFYFGSERNYEQMERTILASTEPVSDRLWTRIEYQESYAIPGHHILADTIPKLSEVGAPEDVRVTFWFSC